ncbi:uncharacterized protein LOC135937612 [Cloeon dipterum]|uniref:uncharacterized protein LOC135937612 n=1 Tax=Cloeon dipterum TaxID=197152 RepID=UPI00322081B1
MVYHHVFLLFIIFFFYFILFFNCINTNLLDHKLKPEVIEKDLQLSTQDYLQLLRFDLELARVESHRKDLWTRKQTRDQANKKISSQMKSRDRRQGIKEITPEDDETKGKTPDQGERLAPHDELKGLTQNTSNEGTQGDEIEEITLADLDTAIAPAPPIPREDEKLGKAQDFNMQNEEEADVHNITQMKFPDFWKNDVEAWFERVDAFFMIRRIKNDGYQVAWIKQHLPENVYLQTRDVFRDLPATDQYDFVKNAILKRLGPTKDQKLQQLLSKEEMGDEKPSVYLRKFQHLAGTDGTDDMVRNIWMGQLPADMRKLLAAHGDRTLEKQAQIAHDIQNVVGNKRSTFSATASRARDESQEDFRRKIEKNQREFQNMMYGMLESIQDLALSMKNRGRSPTRRSDRTDDKDGKKDDYQRKQSRSKSRHRFNKDGTCYYHGSDVCVFPRKLLKSTGALAKTHLDLTAANGTSIKLYGVQPMPLNLGLRRDFTWNFIVADVGKPIIGMDLLHHFDLLVDPKRHKVIKHDTLHHIKTTDGPPVFTRPRRLDPEREAAAKARFMSYIKSGKMRPSSSQWQHVPAVSKNDGSWRDCGDYRMLNVRTVPDRYPIPNIQDATAKLSGCTVFSVLDLPKAFYHIPVNPPDIPKTAITTPFGLFEFIYMPFGLQNASQTFQRFMNEVTRELPFVFVYIDDILVFSHNPDEHAEHLRILFKRLDSYGLVLNASKCVFGASEVDFLGCRISSDGALPLNKHVDTILAFPQPETLGQLRRFLGLLNFYHRWLPNIALDQVPLNQILAIPGLKKQSKIEFSKDAVAAFNMCKQKLAAATKLADPNPNCPLSIVTDASDFGMGGVLQQKHMLEARPFSIFTDHKPLTSAFKEEGKNRSPRQIRHLDFISQFSTDIR